MSGQGQRGKGGRFCSNLFKNMRLGLFGALFVLSKKITSVTWLEVVFLFVRLCQLLSFPLTSPATSANFKSTITPIQILSSFTTPQRFLPNVQPFVWVVCFFIGLSWTIFLLALIVWAGISFLNDNFLALWPLKLLRGMGLLSVSILFQPLFGLLLSPFRCQDPGYPSWIQNGWSCNGGGILALEAVGSLLAILLVLFAAIFSLSFYESNMLSRQVVSKAHGRLDVVFLLISLMLVLVTETFGFMVSVWVQTATMIACGLIYLAAVLYFLPHYHFWWNSLLAGVAGSFLFTSLAIIINITYPQGDAALVIYCGGPLAFGVGVLWANMRASQIVRRPMARLVNPYEIELKARFMLHEALWGHPTERVCFGKFAAQAEAEKAYREHLAHQAATAQAAAVLVAHGGAQSSGTSHGGLTPRLGMSTGVLAAAGTLPAQSHALTTSSAKGSSGAGNGPSDLQILEDVEGDDENDRVAVLKRLIPPSTIEELTDLYKSSAARIAQSATLQLFISRFYALFGNRHLMLSHLAQAERRQPALDTSFIIFQQRKLSGDGSSSSSQNGPGAMTAINRVAFESLAGDARRFVLKAALKQASFWAELTADRPDLSRLHHLSTEMNQAIQGAEKAFAELFILNPQSLNLLRLYAAFSLNVTADVDKASALLAEADRLEDAKAKDHRSEGAAGLQILSESQLDVFADSTSIITIGGTSRNLGLVISTNQPCARLFGYSRLQMERRDFTTILPGPLAEEVSAGLRAYVNTGESWLHGTTRVMLGLHRAGHAFPILMSIRESPPDDGPPTFIVLMRELRSPDQHILLTSDLIISAASAASLAMMGLEPAALQSGECSIKDCISDFEANLSEMLKGIVTLRVDPVTTHHHGGGSGSMMVPYMGGGGGGSFVSPAGINPRFNSYGGIVGGNNAFGLPTVDNSGVYGGGGQGATMMMPPGLMQTTAGGGRQQQQPPVMAYARDPSYVDARVEDDNNNDNDDGAGSTNSPATSDRSDDDADDNDNRRRTPATAGAMQNTRGSYFLPPIHQQQQQGRSTSGFGPMVHQTSQASTAIVAGATPSGSTWIRAQLQRIILSSTSKVAFVLSWQKIPASDHLAIAKAEARRRASLIASQGAAQGVGGMMMLSPSQAQQQQQQQRFHNGATPMLLQPTPISTDGPLPPYTTAMISGETNKRQSFSLGSKSRRNIINMGGDDVGMTRGNFNPYPVLPGQVFASPGAAQDGNTLRAKSGSKKRGGGGNRSPKGQGGGAFSSDESVVSGSAIFSDYQGNPQADPDVAATLVAKKAGSTRNLMAVARNNNNRRGSGSASVVSAVLVKEEAEEAPVVPPTAATAAPAAAQPEVPVDPLLSLLQQPTTRRSDDAVGVNGSLLITTTSPTATAAAIAIADNSSASSGTANPLAAAPSSAETPSARAVASSSNTALVVDASKTASSSLPPLASHAPANNNFRFGGSGLTIKSPSESLSGSAASLLGGGGQQQQPPASPAHGGPPSARRSSLKGGNSPIPSATRLSATTAAGDGNSNNNATSLRGAAGAIMAANRATRAFQQPQQTPAGGRSVYSPAPGGTVPGLTIPNDGGSNNNLNSGSSGQLLLSSAPSGGIMRGSASQRDGGRSEIDGKSQSSGSTGTTKALSRLRRALADSNQPLLPGLFWLRIVGVLVTLLSLGLAAAVVVITIQRFDAYATSVEHTDEGAHMMVDTFNAITSAQYLIEAGKRWISFNSTADEAEYRRAISANMSSFSSILRDTYDYSGQAGFSKDFTQPYVTVTLFDSNGVDAKGEAHEVYNLFTAGLLFPTYLNNIASMANITDLADPYQTDVRFMYTNLVPMGNIHEELHASTMASFAVSSESASSLRQMLIWVYISMASLLLLIAVCIFLPILCNIERSKDAIVVRFVELPIVARRMLYYQAVKRTRSLKRNYLSNDEDDEDDDEDSEAEGAAAALLNQGGNNNNNGSSGVEAAGTGEGGEEGGINNNAEDLEGGNFNVDEEGEENFDWSAALKSASMRSASKGTTLARSSSRSPSRAVSTKLGSAAVAPAPSGGSRRSGASGRSSSKHHQQGPQQRPYRKSSRSFMILVLRFIGPLLALLIFFSTIFGYSMVQLDSVVQLSSASMAANSRFMCSREYQMDLRRLVNEYSDRAFVLDVFAALQDVGECIKYNSELLQFGVPQDKESRGIYVDTTPQVETADSPYLTDAESATVYNAMFSDACPFLAENLPDALIDPVSGKPRVTKAQFLKRCYSFSNGIISQGLHTLIAQYTKKVEILGDRRFRARMGPRLSGPYDLHDFGWLLPKTGPAAYNYTLELSGIHGDEGAVIFDASAVKTVLPPPPVPDISFDGDYEVQADGFTPVESQLNVTKLIPLGLVPYSVADELNSAEMQWILEVDKLYLSPGLGSIADVYTGATTNGIQTLNNFLIIFSAAYLSTFVLFILLVFLPQISRANHDIISKRNVLLYVPPEIAAHPPIKRLIKDILAADAERHGYGYSSAGGGPGTGGHGMNGGGVGGGHGVGVSQSVVKAVESAPVASSGLATLNGTPNRVGGSKAGGGGLGIGGGGGGDADLSAAARMADGGLPLSRTRSFHDNAGSGGGRSNRLTAADI